MGQHQSVDVSATSSNVYLLGDHANPYLPIHPSLSFGKHPHGAVLQQVDGKSSLVQ